MTRVALARAVGSVFWLATALYALVGAIPFASKQFLEPQLIPAVTAFAEWHAWILLAALAITAGALAPWLRARHTGVTALLGTWVLLSVVPFAIGGLADLEPSPLALAISVGALVPPVWLALLDLRGPDARRAHVSTDAGPLPDFLACAVAAVIVSATHVLVTLAPDGGSAAGRVVELGQSALLHLVVFSGIFALISVIRGGARHVGRSEVVEAWLARAAVGAAFALFTYYVALSSLSFTGARAAGVAGAFGAALAVVLAPRGTRVTGGIEAALSGFAPRWAIASPPLAGLWTAIAMGSAAWAGTAIAGSDWNFAIGKLIAFASWLVVLATALRSVPRWVRDSAPARPAGSLMPFAACLLVLGVQQLASTAGPGSTSAGAARSTIDVSSRLILDALTPAAPIEPGLYDYLQRNTNIARSVKVDPVNIELAPLAQPSARRPHIFLFVIDSLRRDYLSPYNPAVDFTPSIDRFAAESTVFERAFTRYGGTGLAIPSIWTGGLLLHKQYVTPFSPMNTLSKLLTAESYAQWVTMEHIVETILPAGGHVLEPLDAGVPVKDHRLCSTLREVRGRLDRLSAQGSPAFVYSLPQDIHVSTIAREAATPVDGRDYNGLNAAYAARVRRMDACFGAFVDDLKARGLYDDSIIILTSDHGDSLGEDGRMGHAYTIFPEVIQVPLLVHLPADLRARFVSDPSSAAFTADITPSLYALLGHAPAQPSPLFGIPLFRAASAAPAARQTAEVVASSYGSVYGALLDDARRLYIVDAVSLREHAYELDGSAAGRAVPVRPADREAGQRAIRQTIEEVSRFYGYQPAAAK